MQLDDRQAVFALMGCQPGRPLCVRLVLRQVAILLSATFAFAMMSGCGYMIGPAFPREVSTVYVPVVKSASNRRDIEYQLTEAVQREIKQRSGIHLAKPPYAQTKLTVRIVELGKNVLGETQFDDPRELQVRLAVSATWEDLRTGQILAQEQLSLAPSVRQFEATGDFTPELGHSMATANQRAVTDVAAKVVDLMEVAW